jgi:NADH pyrophosphatase NudC (nudix superfamily)
MNNYGYVDVGKLADYANNTTIGLTANDIMRFPKADVQPVVHAYWIELPKALNPNENPCECSNCDHVLSFMNYYPKSKYCPNCGAKMDLKDGDIK